MSRGERDCVIEKEQRCPPPGASEWPAPASEFGTARDPQRTSVVAHDALMIVDHAPSVSREHASGAHGVEITPGINAVPSGAR
jgi:hypothetical protein